MPCDTIQTTRIDMGKLDPVILDAAMTDLGMAGKYVYNRETGQVIIRGQRWQANPTDAQIKQAYSAQVVQQTAKKFGWQIKQTGKFQFAVTKR